MDSVISDPSVVVATKEHFSCPLGNDVIILDLRAGLYFSVNDVGALVWQLIQEPRTVGQVRDAVLDSFDVDPQTCERDVRALIQDLVSRNLVEVRDAAAV
jgi:Coenzyme PQQ synthesis protein D (PqqD)